MLAAAGALAVTPAAAHAAGPSVWTGSDVTATPSNSGWTDAANWVGGVAPTSPSGIAFPSPLYD